MLGANPAGLHTGLLLQAFEEGAASTMLDLVVKDTGCAVPQEGAVCIPECPHLLSSHRSRQQQPRPPGFLLHKAHSRQHHRCRQRHCRSSARGRRSSVGETETSAVPPQSWAFSWEMGEKASACLLPGWPPAQGREPTPCLWKGEQCLWSKGRITGGKRRDWFDASGP